MGFVEAIKTCFSKYATFSGRARRPEYWWFFLLNFLVSLIPVVGLIWALIAFIPGLAVGWRRMHDIGKPGYYLLIPMAVILAGVGLTSIAQGSPDLAGVLSIVALVAILGAAILQIVWLASPSQSGTNQFGPEPGSEVNVEGVFE